MAAQPRTLPPLPAFSTFPFPDLTPFISFFFFKDLILFIFGCIGSSLLRGLSLVAKSGGYSLLRCAGFSLCGFSCCGALALDMWASVAVAHRLSSCGTRAQLLRGMQDLPEPGIEPMSPALAGGFLSTAPPGKSLVLVLKPAKRINIR